MEQWSRDVQDALYKRARHFADVFWEEHYLKRDQPDRKQWGIYGVRVSKRNAGISITWVEIGFRGGKGKRQITFQSIPRGAGDGYGIRCFPLAKPWEKTLIPQIEKEFTRLRMLSKTLAEGMSTLRRFNHMLKAEPSGIEAEHLATAMSKSVKSIEQQLIEDYLGKLDDDENDTPPASKPTTSGERGWGGLASSGKRVE